MVTQEPHSERGACITHATRASLYQGTTILHSCPTQLPASQHILCVHRYFCANARKLDITASGLPWNILRDTPPVRLRRWWGTAVSVQATWRFLRRTFLSAAAAVAAFPLPRQMRRGKATARALLVVSSWCGKEVQRCCAALALILAVPAAVSILGGGYSGRKLLVRRGECGRHDALSFSLLLFVADIVTLFIKSKVRNPGT